MGKDFLPTDAIPQGFLFNAVRAGIKASGNLDLAVAFAPKGATAAAMFTTNQMVAAPVVVGRKHLEISGGEIHTLVVNAGNANCATGEAGYTACKEVCFAAAELFEHKPQEVFPSSTGIIGVPLPVEKLIAALPAAKDAMGNTPEHVERFARAIMTTDTKPKVAYTTVEVDGIPARLFGVCKGAGMIGPQLGPPHATMLVYLFTDLEIKPLYLRNLLQATVEPSFNSISIDGDTSTNDTVLMMASGACGAVYAPNYHQHFQAALLEVCESLAHQIVDDGEGVTHVVTLQINRAHSEQEAKQIAKAIAHSPLCKTAWSSADPNWGRLIAAVGYSGVSFDPAKVSIHIGQHPVFEHGTVSPQFDKAATHATMQQREFTITVDMGQGEASCRFLTCDLTVEYVHINADYST
ncbi:MAG: bifunctional glutamate N-acetyltransferase/amino-acid acetyltransferase ArgJ [Acidobacteriaceae bacterium]